MSKQDNIRLAIKTATARISEQTGLRAISVEHIMREAFPRSDRASFLEMLSDAGIRTLRSNGVVYVRV